MVKKFKNGNVTLSVKKDLETGYYDTNNIENFIHDEMFMSDLYIQQIQGYLYIVDFNKNLVYDFPCESYDGVKNFINKLLEEKNIKLVPYNKKASKSYLEDLENGY